MAAPGAHPNQRHGEGANRPFRLRTELSRERDALKYLQAWSELFQPQFLLRNAFPADDRPKPETCKDNTLSALAQLASLRLNTRRVFVSLLSRDREYVLAEATRTMSLQSDVVGDHKDGTWLGTCSFNRAEGMNDLAIDSWRKARAVRNMPQEEHYFYTEGVSPHWFLVNDLMHHPHAASRAFVKRATLPRFFFSVPLRDYEGSVIGALTFLDTLPRFGISSSEMLFCEDLSDTISQHLHSSVLRLQRQRSERLIQALGSFNNHGSSLREWWLSQDNSSIKMNRGGGRYADRTMDLDDQKVRLDEEFGVQNEDDNNRETSDAEQTALPRSRRRPTPSDHESSPTTKDNSEATASRSQSGVQGADFGSSSETSATRQNDSDHGSVASSPASRKRRTSLNRTDAFNYAREVRLTYGRASNLLKEALSATGVAFVDATAASSAKQARPVFSRKLTNQESRSDPTPTSSSDSHAATSDTDNLSDATKQARHPAKGLGFSTYTQSTIAGSRTFPFQIPERQLVKMIKSYPMGKVFNFVEDSDALYSGSEESPTSDATSGTPTPHANTRQGRYGQSLRKLTCMAKAKAIAFFPIWDDDGERWRSCVFVWGSRLFDPVEDITYLSAFGHSLRSQIAHFDALAADGAKSRFISSVSHELRSPLHGILAGIELIQDSQMTVFQSEMATSVALAGRTLLDTVNHILDWSKVSNLSKSEKRDRAKADASRHKSGSASEGDNDGENYLVDVDLSRLTEEVVESVVNAHRFESTASNRRHTHAVSMVLEIEKRPNWIASIIPGAYTRLITNILGNALKYTPKGLITVKLFATPSRIPGRDHVQLHVIDTGIGMSKSFLEHDLFSPFKQADSHTVGTGLGLSIVREIARRDFRASVDVQSEIGQGTTFIVKFEASLNEAENGSLDTALPSAGDAELLKQQSFHVLSLQGGSNSATALGANALAEGMYHTALQWTECNASLSGSVPTNSRPGLCVVLESDLIHLNQRDPNMVDSLMGGLATSASGIFVLARSVSTNRPTFKFEQFSIPPVYILQPVGPRKLIRTLQKARELAESYHPGPANDKSDAALRVVRGDSQDIDDGDSGEEEVDNSYFQLPVTAGNPSPPTSGPLATPGSFFEDVTMRSPGRARSGGIAKQSRSRPANTSRNTSELQNTTKDLDEKVLLVEDNEINMRLLIALMKKQNLQYQCAVNGLEALQAYKKEPLSYFLILMDMSMPVMDGFQSTVQIREWERKNKMRRIQITALTGVTNSESRKSAFDAGVDKYLTKPIRMKDLTTLVAEIQQQGEDG